MTTIQMCTGKKGNLHLTDEHECKNHMKSEDNRVCIKRQRDVYRAGDNTVNSCSSFITLCFKLFYVSVANIRLYDVVWSILGYHGDKNSDSRR